MSRREAPIHKASGQIRACRNREHAEAEVGGEYSAAKFVFALHLQQRRREYPHDRTAKMREHDAETCLPEMSRYTQQRVPGGRSQISPEDRYLQTMLPVSRPSRG